MIPGLGRKKGTPGAADFIVAFVQSWEMRRSDETTICSGTLDVLRAYLGDRPCAIWVKNGPALNKVSERGMVEILFSQDRDTRQSALNRSIVSGAAEFDGVPVSALAAEEKSSYDGFLNIPIKILDGVSGVLTLAVKKKEARDVAFIEPLECLARLIGMALQECREVESNNERERRLRSEVEATTRELAQTNKRLIDRVRELKTLYGELQEKVKELMSANKAKDEFLSIVSHELRTPLTSLNGFLCVLLDEEAGTVTPEQKRFLTIAKHSADRLNLLISDLLDISRIESGRLTLEMSTCSLLDIVTKSAEQQQRNAAAKNIEIRVAVPKELPLIWGDVNRLQQVLDNLISNSIKFIERTGFVEITAEEKGDFIQVAVRDNGPGIAAEDQKKVFDLFYQTEGSLRRTSGGAGLGLSIAHGIVAMHGGHIWVESEKGIGSIFKFVVPRTREHKAA